MTETSPMFRFVSTTGPQNSCAEDLEMRKVIRLALIWQGAIICFRDGHPNYQTCRSSFHRPIFSLPFILAMGQLPELTGGETYVQSVYPSPREFISPQHKELQIDRWSAPLVGGG